MTKRANYLFAEQKDGLVVLSMTPELQDDVGTVGFVEFTTESELEVDSAIATLEASKTVLEIPSPLVGKVVEVNEAAVKTPKLINSADANENWLVKLGDVDQAAFDALEEA